jgi:hypothetical protein
MDKKCQSMKTFTIFQHTFCAHFPPPAAVLVLSSIYAVRNGREALAVWHFSSLCHASLTTAGQTETIICAPGAQTMGTSLWSTRDETPHMYKNCYRSQLSSLVAIQYGRCWGEREKTRSHSVKWAVGFYNFANREVKIKSERGWIMGKSCANYVAL